jgi:hypothetical protein
MAAPIQIKGLEEAIRYLSSFPDKKKQEMTEVLNAWSYRVTTAASPKSPVGVTGRLAKDAKHVLIHKGERIESHLGFNLPYAKYVHGVNAEGKWLAPRRHFVPYAIAPSLEAWARMHGFDTSKSKGLMVWGEEKADPFLYRTAKQLTPSLIAAFQKLGGV